MGEGCDSEIKVAVTPCSVREKGGLRPSQYFPAHGNIDNIHGLGK
jgi:hypothetical protein